MTQTITPTTRILRLPELRRRCGLGRTAIYERITPTSKLYDPNFPKPIVLSGNKLARAVGFVESEVEDYLGGACRGTG